MKIENAVLAALSDAITHGPNLTLADKMDRKMYLKVNKVLEAAGAQWSRERKVHIFDGGDAAERMEQILLTGEVTIPKDEFDFFPSPPAVVDYLMFQADIKPGMLCLEPSAGTGNIARAMAAIVGHKNVCTYEAQGKLSEALGRDGYFSIHCSFLMAGPNPVYDRIVMNPPFSKRQDIHHVMHAMGFLKPGGRLVSVMSAGVEFREDALARNFRMMVARHPKSRILKNQEGSFKSSGTMVNTVTVVIQG